MEITVTRVWMKMYVGNANKKGRMRGLVSIQRFQEESLDVLPLYYLAPTKKSGMH